MFKIRNQKYNLAVFIVMIICLLASSLLAVSMTWYASAAENSEKVKVTTKSYGQVTLGELCERYDVLYAMLPGGESYLQQDPSLEGVKDRITVLDTTKYLNISNNGELIGFQESIDAYYKILLVVPRSVTKFTVDNSTGGAGNLHPFRSSASAKIVGLAFQNGSTMSEIAGGGSTSAGVGAFTSFSNLSFVLLPNTIQKIGNCAFSKCDVLQEIVMPAVATIGKYAFYRDTSLYHISIPTTTTAIDSTAFTNTTSLCDIENNSAKDFSDVFKYAFNSYTADTRKSYLYIWENYGYAYPSITDGYDYLRKDREVNNSLIFSYNNSRTDTLCTVSSNVQTYKKQKWYFVGMNGVDDKYPDFRWEEKSEYYFPNKIDLTATRSKIKWDFLGSDGTKYINEFTVSDSSSEAVDRYVTQYDIGYGACYNRTITRIFLPEAETSSDVGIVNIGDFAFYGSQINIVKIPSTVRNIGCSAFRMAHREKARTDSNIYIGGEAGANLKVGDWAFSYASNFATDFPTAKPSTMDNVNRKFIFANKAAYDAETNRAVKYNSAGDSTVTYTYLIPINAVTVDGSGIQEKKFVRDGLYGYTFDTTMNNNMTWSQKSKVSFPVLDGYESNVWYRNSKFDVDEKSENYSGEWDASTGFANNLYADVKYLSEKLKSDEVSEINLYTMKIAVPDCFENKEYQYGEDVFEKGDAASGDIAERFLTFSQALYFTESDDRDYYVALDSFVDFNNLQNETSVVQNAGRYTLRVTLNARWGAWDGTKDIEYEVVVNRAIIDLGDPNNLPVFSTEGGIVLGGEGDGKALYEYSEGWYLYPKADDIKEPSVVVLNSYTRRTGGQITIAASGADRKYNVTNAKNISATASGRYLSSFDFVMVDPNYIFANSTRDANSETLSKLGISYSTLINDNTTSVTVNKYWYVVVQQNYFVDAGNADNDTYNLLTLNGVATHTIKYEDADFDSGALQVHIPKCAEGSISVDEITFTITYGAYNAPITVADDGELCSFSVTELNRYVNKAMPAGSYTIKIHAPAAGASLPEINDIIHLVVMRGDLDIENIQELLDSKTFRHKYDGNVHLFDVKSSDQLSEFMITLKKKLDTARNTIIESVWKDVFYNQYYGVCGITYNLDRMAENTYYSEESLSDLNIAKVPCNIGEYIVYYSVLAFNYEPVGGATANDRRDYCFTTTIYREISTKQFALGDTIKNLTYNGEIQTPNVPYSAYYSYHFPDEDYKNVGVKKIKFTLNDSILSEWAKTDTPGNVIIDGDVVTVLFNVTPASNSWVVQPQIPSWFYDGFDLNINVLTASLAFSGADVTYVVVVPGKDDIRFTVSEDGRVGNAVRDALSKLSPGTYTLTSIIDNIVVNEVINVEGRSFDSTLTVLQAVNYWEETPNVVRWDWDDFDRNVNTISATPKYLNIDSEVEGKVVKYTVLNSSKQAVYAALINFTSITEDVEDALKTLGAGEYYLLAVVDESNYYTGINTVDSEICLNMDLSTAKGLVFFEVYKADSEFSKTPAVIDWTYGEFSAGENFVEGVSVFANYGETVLYGLYMDSGATNAYIYNGEQCIDLDASAIKNVMSGLEADVYYLSAYTVASDITFDNVWIVPYPPVRFNVNIFINDWDVPPSFDFSSFSYGSLPVMLEPKPQKGSVSYRLNGRDIDCYTDWVTELNILDVESESYTLTVWVDGVGGQYSGIEGRDYAFYVTYGENKWDVFPDVSGYVWGAENASLSITEGVPVFNKNNSDITRYFYKASLDPLTGQYERGERLEATPLDAGTYMYVTTVPASGNYDELVDITLFTIVHATNYWKSHELVDEDGSLNTDLPIEWTWSRFSDWNAIEAQYGTTYYAINGSTSSTDEALNDQLRALNAGRYTLYVSSDATNWTGLSAALTIVVNKVPNNWDGGVRPSLSKTSWEYNTTAGVIQNAVVNHGTIVVTYYTRSDGEVYGDGSQMPIAVGEYVVELKIDYRETDNWTDVDIVRIGFDITQATDKSFVVQPSATGWVYGEYRREVHLFSAIPTTRGGVMFSVLYNDQVVVVDGVRLEGIELDRDGLVSADVAGLLAKLEGGSSVDANARTYVLKVSVAGTTNYKEFDSSVSFTVSAARNEWVVTPQVSPWAVHQWTAVSTPQAVSLFGVAHIEIKSQYGSSIYYSADYDSVSDTTTITINRLQDATAGWYILTATVLPHSGQYNNELSQDIVFQIFIQGLTSPDNHWVEIPSIVGWTANENGADGVNLPNGSPLRGTTYFVFYKAKLVNDVYQPDEDAEVTAANGILIKADSSDFVGKDYYVPYEPGYYVLKAYVIFYNAEGEPVDEDGLDPEFVPFEIRMRVNSFVDEPRIETLLYLGDIAAWSLPTAKSLEGSVTYTYKLQDSDDEPTTEMPNKPGKYLLIATASAKYCEDIVRTVKFTVELSPNSWLSAPMIKDWSEETGPNDPFGEAAVGSENIMYTYASAKDPSKILTEKPTAEGSYIMYATLEMEGYETITAEYAFIIESAWDTQLLLIDIILGLVVCACTIVVIIFAIRRYKEC